MDTPQKIGRYEVIEELGQGAMGTVYRAKDPAMDRIVAVKTIISVMLAGQQQSEFRERFFREARAAGGLAHPGIVPVFDIGEHEGMPFLVMEFVKGRTLADLTKKGERLSLDRVCEIGQKIAEALAYAHQHGVVHRDIKPANILLTSRETYGIERPKITDFGVAKMAEGQTTMTGQLLGTPAFMPPEQFTGEPIDGRADIFSLGVVLYWMATGEQPFPGESMTAVSYKVVHTDPVPPRKLNPSLPMKIDTIIMKCLAKNPSERYQTGDELALDLGELRKGGLSQGPALQAIAHGNDPDATAMGASPMQTARPTASSQETPVAAVPNTPRDNRVVLVGVIATVVLAGGWYAMRTRQQSVIQPVAPPTVGTSAVPAAPVADTQPKKPTPAATSAGSPSADPAAGKPGAKAEANAKVTSQPKASRVSPGPAALDFDPRMLDPKQNARLKIDTEQMPAELDFTVEMNGKLYLRKSGGGNKSQDDGFFVPPGVHEFRVTAKSGTIEKVSNTVSTEFKAKKRNTLKIELRIQGKAQNSGMPQGLYPDAQIVLSLK